MRNRSWPAAEEAPEDAGAVGIVVQGGPVPASRPGVRFVWGREVSPTPSLPFGRWKAARAAA